MSSRSSLLDRVRVIQWQIDSLQSQVTELAAELEGIDEFEVVSAFLALRHRDPLRTLLAVVEKDTTKELLEDRVSQLRTLSCVSVQRLRLGTISKGVCQINVGARPDVIWSTSQPRSTWWCKSSTARVICDPCCATSGSVQ